MRTRAQLWGNENVTEAGTAHQYGRTGSHQELILGVENLRANLVKRLDSTLDLRALTGLRHYPTIFAEVRMESEEILGKTSVER